ncbi:Crp/Fnr family transcriptional regulator [Corynebacterium sp. NML 150383]|uniref:ROK family transcriptional regulator n=1 Tax=Corynebacterium sp. NML 150383 TaxID=2029400 RepID=UPI000BAA6321|nr:ROK family transcriptional regulator [Corynebacterium sp. NML 150383]PAT03171.1 Crp/Fnr family transcriptional regulator [Corynebacterium sp. NML 150383]
MTCTTLPFTRPTTPAAKCLHLIRLQDLTSRSELVQATGLSQPTVTRAIAALTEAGLVNERTDLTRSTGRGRPTIPLELAEPDPIYGGIAVGTDFTYVAVFDLRGRTLRCVDLELPVASMTPDDVIQHLMAALNRLTAGMQRRLAALGVTTSGTVTEDGTVIAVNLGWDGVDLAEQLREQFSVPVEVTSISAAIIGSEMQSNLDLGDGPIMALFADDSIGCAVSTGDGVQPIRVKRHELTTRGLLERIHKPGLATLLDAVQDSSPDTRTALDERARDLGSLVAKLSTEHAPSTVVIAGSAFIDDPHAPAPFARTVRAEMEQAPELRMIPTHAEVVRDIARAAALDLVLREPLTVAAS